MTVTYCDFCGEVEQGENTKVQVGTRPANDCCEKCTLRLVLHADNKSLRKDEQVLAEAARSIFPYTVELKRPERFASSGAVAEAEGEGQPPARLEIDDDMPF